jgi:hypothetical protein
MRLQLIRLSANVVRARERDLATSLAAGRALAPAGMLLRTTHTI